MSPPKLLISVRNVAEALLAAREAVPIIDIKEPVNGSLGMADPSVIEASVRAIKQENPACLTSAACGEVLDWEISTDLKGRSLPQLGFQKLGLAGLRNRSNWPLSWRQARQQVEDRTPTANEVKWVAVAYVDEEAAQSPPIREIIQLAAEDQCAGVLFDTFKKSGQRFFDWMTEVELLTELKSIHSAGMFCAVAGRLSLPDVARLARWPVDVIAVRSAACDAGKRTASLSRSRIRHLQQVISTSDPTRRPLDVPS